MKISLILCTLGDRDQELKRLLSSLESQTYKNFELIIVSQINHNPVETALLNSKLTYKHIKINKKGLSLARNIGLQYVSGDFCSISDDDCWYPENGLMDVVETIKRNSLVKIFSFKIFDPISNCQYKDFYWNESKFLNKLTIGKVSSIELFFSNEIINKGIRFDENFGLGAKFPSGEENIFLSDILKTKSNILFQPKFIVYHLKLSKEKKLLTYEKMQVTYNVFVRMFGVIGFPIYYIFYLKHFSNITKRFKSLFPF
ncbi:MAG: glycosyltransferase family 2 protein [Labilibaculum sp.]|nr:glycosyltransferase family A protein [Labilibaculum sp.]MBI9059639.1 glycosyltransferase family 2 protein [Labilibaculum sp.]